MASKVEVPTLGESVTEAILTQWLKAEGDEVAVDEPLCELESDKATVDLPSPAQGVLHQLKKAGETAQVGEVIARIESTGQSEDGRAAGAVRESGNGESSAQVEEPQKPSRDRPRRTEAQEQPRVTEATEPGEVPPATGPGRPEEQGSQSRDRKPRKKTLADDTPQAVASPTNTVRKSQEPSTEPTPPVQAVEEGVRRVPMSRIRRSIAERLVRSQQSSATLTTFNEIDMSAVQELRTRHGERFRETHGVSLGLTSFFARACGLALPRFPNINAQIDNGDIVYYDHVHLGIAVSTDRGLIVPVLHNVETMSLVRIEAEIKRAAAAARVGKLTIKDLSGGTFTITNGGVFGSLLSTPLINPPQSGILGLHTIQDRPVVRDGRIEARPMMYVALTYDHRLVDGEESVSFLVRIKQLIEDPIQVILEL